MEIISSEQQSINIQDGVFIYKIGCGCKWTQQKSHFTFRVYTHTNVISHSQNTWFKDKH
jgi:hypothetical protein